MLGAAGWAGMLGRIMAEETKNPPRWWWAKRLAPVVAALLAAPFVIAWWTNHLADRQFAAAVAARRAKGEAVYYEDYTIPSLPTEDDGLQQTLTICNLLTKSPKQAELIDATDFANDESILHLRDDQWQIVCGCINDNAAVIEKNRELRQHRLQIPLSSSWTNGTLFGPWTQMRELARFLQMTALAEIRRGNVAAAAKLVRDMRVPADAAERSAPSLAGGMIAIAIQSLSAETAMLIAQHLTAEQRRSTDAELRAVIGDLLDGSDRDERVRIRFEGERTVMLETIRSMLVPQANSFTRPFIKATTIELMENVDLAREAHLAHNWPAAKAILPNSPPQQVHQMLTSMLLPSFAAAAERDFRLLAHRRAAAVLLALRMYELDHGQLPQRLDQLVPDYLPKVPEDPFTANGLALAYVRDGERPRVYSVGADGVDDGGDLSQLRPRGDNRRPDKFQCVDACFDLRPEAMGDVVVDTSRNSWGQSLAESADGNTDLNDQAGKPAEEEQTGRNP